MKICRASSSMPLLTPIVNIEDVPYLDGGLADSVPIRRAKEIGNEKIVVVLTKNAGYRKKVLSPAMQKLYRKAYSSYPNVVRTILRRSFMYNKTMNYLDVLERKGEIFVIRPHVKPVSRLEPVSYTHLLSGQLLCDILHDNLKYIMLGHLSRENNYAKLAYETVKLEVTLADNEYKGEDLDMFVASRDSVSEIVTV